MSKTRNPLVSIIITNYNGEKFLDLCLKSIENQNYQEIEIIFADDCSTDNSIKFVELNFPNIKISKLDENSGLSINSNKAREIANGDFLLFFNNDTFMPKDFISNCVEKIKNDNGDAICVMQYPYNEKDDYQYLNDYHSSDIGTGIDCFGYVCTAKDAGFIFYPDAHIFMKTEVFDNLGGFDPNILLYGEDVDLFWRFHLSNYKLTINNDIYFRHNSSCVLGPQDKIKTTFFRRKLVERQSLYMMLKYYNIISLIFLIPIRIFLNFLESTLFVLIYRNIKFYDIFFSSIYWNINKKKIIYIERTKIKKIRKINDMMFLRKTYIGYRKIKVFFQNFKLPEIK